MSVSIRGLGLYVPERIVTNDAWPADFAERARSGDRTLNDMELSSDYESGLLMDAALASEEADPFLGATERRYADDAMTSSEAAGLAAIEALKDSDVDPKDIDVILTYDAVTDRVSLQPGAIVANMIGSRKNVMYTVTENACGSCSTQLTMARGLIETGEAEHVLCTQTSLWTRTFPFLHPASPGVGDGASAFVVSKGKNGLTFVSNYAAGHPDHVMSVGWVRQEGDDTPWYHPGCSFKFGTKNLAGAKHLMRETISFGYQTIANACLKANVVPEDIDLLACVQPRGFVPGLIAQRLGLSSDIAPHTYDRYAHIGASGVIANLIKARNEGRFTSGTRGSLIALYGQGTGFTRMATLLRANL